MKKIILCLTILFGLQTGYVMGQTVDPNTLGQLSQAQADFLTGTATEKLLSDTITKLLGTGEITQKQKSAFDNVINNLKTNSERKFAYLGGSGSQDVRDLLVAMEMVFLSGLPVLDLFKGMRKAYASAMQNATGDTLTGASRAAVITQDVLVRMYDPVERTAPNEDAINRTRDRLVNMLTEGQKDLGYASVAPGFVTSQINLSDLFKSAIVVTDPNAEGKLTEEQITVIKAAIKWVLGLSEADLVPKFKAVYAKLQTSVNSWTVNDVFVTTDKPSPQERPLTDLYLAYDAVNAYKNESQSNVPGDMLTALGKVISTVLFANSTDYNDRAAEALLLMLEDTLGNARSFDPEKESDAEKDSYRQFVSRYVDFILAQLTTLNDDEKKSLTEALEDEYLKYFPKATAPAPGAVTTPAPGAVTTPAPGAVTTPASTGIDPVNFQGKLTDAQSTFLRGELSDYAVNFANSKMGAIAGPMQHFANGLKFVNAAPKDQAEGDVATLMVGVDVTVINGKGNDAANMPGIIVAMIASIFGDALKKQAQNNRSYIVASGKKQTFQDNLSKVLKRLLGQFGVAPGAAASKTDLENHYRNLREVFPLLVRNLILLSNNITNLPEELGNIYNKVIEEFYPDAVSFQAYYLFITLTQGNLTFKAADKTFTFKTTEISPHYATREDALTLYKAAVAANLILKAGQGGLSNSETIDVLDSKNRPSNVASGDDKDLVALVGAILTKYPDLLTSPAPGAAPKFSVVLKDFPKDKTIAAIKAVRSKTNLGLKEAKDAVEDNLPFTIPNLSRTDADELLQAFGDINATADLIDAGGNVVDSVKSSAAAPTPAPASGADPLSFATNVAAGQSTSTVGTSFDLPSGVTLETLLNDLNNEDKRAAARQILADGLKNDKFFKAFKDKGATYKALDAKADGYMQANLLNALGIYANTGKPTVTVGTETKNVMVHMIEQAKKESFYKDTRLSWVTAGVPVAKYTGKDGKEVDADTVDKAAKRCVELLENTPLKDKDGNQIEINGSKKNLSFIFEEQASGLAMMSMTRTDTLGTQSRQKVYCGAFVMRSSGED